jgi:hypothetical protein
MLPRVAPNLGSPTTKIEKHMAFAVVFLIKKQVEIKDYESVIGS